MAHLQRLIWFAVGVLIVALPMLAFAEDRIPVWTWKGEQHNSIPAAALTLSCTVRVASFNNPNAVSVGWSFSNTGQVQELAPMPAPGVAGSKGIYCPYTLSGNGPYYDATEGTMLTITWETPPTCPEGRTWNANLQTCETSCQAKGGNSVGTSSEWVTVDLDRIPSGNPSFCTDGCVATGQKVECISATSNVSGDYLQVGQLCSIQGPFTYTGGACEGNTPNMLGAETDATQWWDTGKDEKDCVASGGMPGQVDGKQVCVRRQDGETWDTRTGSTSTPTNTTTTNADGTTTTTTTTTSTSTSGGTSTTKTTETTTIRDADGNIISETTTETTKDEPINDFCAKNPKDPACVGGAADGKFEGSCASGFKCSGDAVMCAVARAQHESNCELAVSEDVLGQFAAIREFGGTGPGEGLDRQQIDVPTALSVSEIGGGSGLQDQSFSVMGKSIEIPFSMLNQYIEMLGYAIMLIAWIGAWRIIAGAF